MSRQSAISAIITMMESGPEPVSGMGGQNAMGLVGVDVGMSMMQGGDDYNDDNCDVNCGFHPDDYLIAKQLVAQVGSVERARELLENLDEIYETLDLQPDNDEESIAYIAGHVPDDVDFPTSRGGGYR